MGHEDAAAEVGLCEDIGQRCGVVDVETEDALAVVVLDLADACR